MPTVANRPSATGRKRFIPAVSIAVSALASASSGVVRSSGARPQRWMTRSQ